MKSTLLLLFAILIAISHARLQFPVGSAGSNLGIVPKFDNPAVINDMTSQDAHKATAVPLFKDQQVNSGFVQIKESGSSMYFIVYSALKASMDAPIILWLQGGPGASSWFGNLTEMGPYSVEQKNGGYELVPREYTWNENYHMIFIDNPFGAGFSYACDAKDYVTNEDEVAANMHKMLTVFFEKFPEYAKNDFYLFGESYGGHYVPAIGKYILEQNETADFKINLKAAGIGDGWTDPIIQMQSYAYFSFANALADEYQAQQVKSMQDASVKAIEAGKMAEAGDYMNKILNKITKEAGGIDQYNYREFPSQSGSSFDPLSILESPEFKKDLHVPTEVSFGAGGEACGIALTNDFMMSMKDRLPYILERIPLLLYNGQDDLIVNTPGAEDWIRTIDWPHREEYLQADRSVWKNQDGQIAGYRRNVHTLVQIVVLKAGHMVPANQPKNAQNMVKNFVDFVDHFHADREEKENVDDQSEFLF